MRMSTPLFFYHYTRFGFLTIENLGENNSTTN